MAEVTTRRVLNEYALRDPGGAMRLLLGKVTAKELVAEKPDVWREVQEALRK